MSALPAATFLVVAKSPIPGRAKTRLAPALSPQQAAEVAAAALLDTLDTVWEAARATGSGPPVVAWDGDPDDGARAAEVSEALARCHVVLQADVPFADRLVAAHRDAAAVGAGRALVQIGMDTPQVTVAHLVQSAAALHTADAALGWAEDGGWWALAIREPSHAEALREVPMSRPDTAARTWAALTDRGLRVARLAVLRDVDTWEDAQAVAPLAGARFRQTVRQYALTRS